MKWYVYELSDADGVFYVGKGCGNRIETTKKQGAPEKIKRAENCKAKIIKRFAYEREAFTYEKQRIEYYGIDNLTNQVPGKKSEPYCGSRRPGMNDPDDRFVWLQTTVVTEDHFEVLMESYPEDESVKDMVKSFYRTLVTVLFDNPGKWLERTKKQKKMIIQALELMANKVPRYG